MKMTRKIVAAVRKACHEACGGRRDVDVGYRHWPGQTDRTDGAEDGPNFLLWGEDSDLDDCPPLSSLIGVNIADNDGWVALDGYCHTTGPDGELDANVDVLIGSDGSVRYASICRMDGATAINKILQEAGHRGYSPK